MNYVTLIHPFEVEADQEKNFLNAWKKVDQYMKKQKGFIETKLHVALSHPKLKAFSYVNIAIWEKSELFLEAVNNDTFKLLAKAVLPFSKGAGLYQVLMQ